MDSVSIQFILQWAILPLVLVVVWIIRKLLLIESEIVIMKAESNARLDYTRQARSELMNAINTHNKNVMTRLTSIEEYLRKER